MIATATIVEPQLEESTALTPNEGPSKHRIPVFNKTFSFNLRSFLPGGDDFSLRRFSIIEAAMLLIMGYLASKGLGVVRQTIFNALFGTGMQANAYYAASRLPDTLFDLIAGGALTHAFIPIFLSYEKDRGQQEAWRLASLVFNVLLVALTALVFVSEFVAPAFVSRLLVPGYPPAQQALTAALTRVMLIQPLILGLGTVVTAILNSKRQFFLPALSLAIYNVGLIGGLLFSLAIPRIGIYGPTYGVLAAAALQVLVMVPALVKQGVRYTFIWDLRNPGLRQVMRLLIPNALAVAIASTGFIVDTAFISYLPDQASLAAERNAHMLYALPLALLGLAIGQAALPQLSSLAASGRYVRLRMTVVKLIGGSLSLRAQRWRRSHCRPMARCCREMAPRAPGGERARESSRALEGDRARANCGVGLDLPQVDHRQRPDARDERQVHVVTRILEAHIHLPVVDDEPEAPQFDFHIRELEQKNCPVSRELPEIEAPVHHPCEDLGIDLRWPNLVLRPTLAPHAEGGDDRAQLLSRSGQAVFHAL